MKIEFTKMHGLGNDYIYIYCPDREIAEPSALALRLSRRRFSVGSDGLVLILPSEIADFKMRIFNADGSEARMCGNGIRCVAKYVSDKGLIGNQRNDVTIETLSGIRRIGLIRDAHGEVVAARVDMGMPSFVPTDVPVLVNAPQIAAEWQVGGQTYSVTALSVGNPHAVCAVPDPDEIQLERIGPIFERHPLFPDRVNTEFISVDDPTHVRMRVWERGSGETFACGTGACAAVAASVVNGACQRDTDVTVSLRGGELIVRYSSDGHLYMTGEAVSVYDGVLNTDI